MAGHRQSCRHDDEPVLFAFEPGAVWDAYVPAEDGASPDGVTITVNPEPRKIAAQSISASDDGITIRQGAAALTGIVTNEGLRDVFSTVFGTFLNGTGKIGGATAPLTNVPTDESVGFELSLPIEGTPCSTPSDYKLILNMPDGKGCLC